MQRIASDISRIDTRLELGNTSNPFGSTTNGADVAIEILDTVNTGHTSSSGNKTITAANTDDQTYTT